VKLALKIDLVLAGIGALIILTIAGCGPVSDPGTTQQALIDCHTPVVAAHQAKVLTNDGVCRVYNAAFGYWNPVLVDNYLLSQGTVVHVEVGPNTGVWVCPDSTPAGWTQTHDNPCWNGVGNAADDVRIRGPLSGTTYAAAGRDVVRIAGKSFVVTQGQLPAPPTCPYYYDPNFSWPLNESDCGTLSDDGWEDIRQNTDPGNNTSCCNVSAAWPGNVGYGRSCTGHAQLGNGNYAAINYNCPRYEEKP
jgi:hypothetical protein